MKEIKWEPNFRQHNQKQIKRQAHTAALHVLINGVNYQDLTDVEKNILEEIATRLIVKYFNGRAIELLTPAYTQAEAEDITLERNEEITNLPKFLPAIAQLIVALDKFFKAHDKEELES